MNEHLTTPPAQDVSPGSAADNNQGLGPQGHEVLALSEERYAALTANPNCPLSGYRPTAIVSARTDTAADHVLVREQDDEVFPDAADPFADVFGPNRGGHLRPLDLRLTGFAIGFDPAAGDSSGIVKYDPVTGEITPL